MGKARTPTWIWEQLDITAHMDESVAACQAVLTSSRAAPRFCPANPKTKLCISYDGLARSTSGGTNAKARKCVQTFHIHGLAL